MAECLFIKADEVVKMLGVPSPNSLTRQTLLFCEIIR